MLDNRDTRSFPFLFPAEFFPLLFPIKIPRAAVSCSHIPKIIFLRCGKLILTGEQSRETFPFTYARLNQVEKSISLWKSCSFNGKKRMPPPVQIKFYNIRRTIINSTTVVNIRGRESFERKEASFNWFRAERGQRRSLIGTFTQIYKQSLFEVGFDNWYCSTAWGQLAARFFPLTTINRGNVSLFDLQITRERPRRTAQQRAPPPPPPPNQNQHQNQFTVSRIFHQGEQTVAQLQNHPNFWSLLFTVTNQN